MAILHSDLADPVPLDIVITIIDELALMKDYRSIQACSFICRAVLRCCQKHLFRAFDTTDYLGWDAHRLVVSYYQLLTWSPHIIPYVKVFRLIPISVDFMWSEFLPVILDKLIFLHTFEMSLAGRSERGWYDLEPDFIQSLRTLASLPSLHTLSFQDVGEVPASFFIHCAQVKVLHLQDVEIEDDMDVSSDEASPFPHEASPLPLPLLDELEIPDSQQYDLHPGVFYYFNVSRLRKLAIQCPLPHDASWHMIEKTRKFLTHLIFHDLQLYYDSDDEDSPFNLPLPDDSLELSQRVFGSLPVLDIFEFTILMNIHSAQFDFSHLEDYHPNLHPFHRWSELLQSAPPSLRKISMSLDCFPLVCTDVLRWFDTPSSSLSPSSTMAQWASLDEIFSNRNNLPNLQLLEVNIKLPESSNDTSDSDSSVEYEEPYSYLRPPGDGRILSVDLVVAYTERRLVLTRRRGILEVLTETG